MAVGPATPELLVECLEDVRESIQFGLRLAAAARTDEILVFPVTGFCCAADPTGGAGRRTLLQNVGRLARRSGQRRADQVLEATLGGVRRHVLAPRADCEHCVATSLYNSPAIVISSPSKRSSRSR